MRARMGGSEKLLAAFLAVWGCSGSPPPPAAATRPLNVLLITIDTLRADAVGAYGNPRAATPWIDRLAAAGVRFESAHAHNVVTLPSHANILSGLYPTDHGVRDNAGFRFPGTIPTLATVLKERGYATAAFISAFPLASRFGLARGFDVYEDSFVDAIPRTPLLEQERSGADTVALARRWLDAHAGEPTFSLGPPVRTARPVCPARAVRVAVRGATRTPVMSRRRTRRWNRSSGRSWLRAPAPARSSS